jgi:DNA-binding response OmpR family regulator
LILASSADAAKFAGWFSAHGLRARATDNPAEAEARVTERRPWLYLLDADLSRPSFLDLVKRAGELSFAGARVVVVGGEADPAWMIVCLSAGADAFLVKPVDEAALLSAALPSGA